VEVVVDKPGEPVDAGALVAAELDALEEEPPLGRDGELEVLPGLEILQVFQEGLVRAGSFRGIWTKVEGSARWVPPRDPQMVSQGMA